MSMEGIMQLILVLATVVTLFYQIGYQAGKRK